MTYYPDLSRYEYDPRDEDRSYFNVGWLESGHAYPTQPPDCRIVNALLRCCLRPAREMRGFHTCDLGCESSSGFDMLEMQYLGRQVRLGNGEVRVAGSDGQHYAAPTLVAHYVAAHNYVPPEPFVDGVMCRAKEIHVLHGEKLLRLRTLSVAERFALCLDAVQALQVQQHDDWLDNIILGVNALKPGLDSPNAVTHDGRRKRLWEVRYADEREDPIAVAGQSLCTFALIQLGEWADVNDDEILDLSATVLECVHDAGLLGWREDMRPLLWDEKAC